MSRIFLGKALHWAVLALVIGILWWMGSQLMQTRDYHSFLLILVLATAGAIAVMILTTRKGELVTREPFGTDDAQGGD